MKYYIIFLSFFILNSCDFNSKTKISSVDDPVMPDKVVVDSIVNGVLIKSLEKDSLVETVFGSDMKKNEACTYLCPEDELWCLSNTYTMRINKAGHIVYMWRCDGDSSHNYWVKG
tara:strand:+ start:100 stop:444 length:345 start_codon:yes stop_codon:yes gene_type:complete